MQRPTQRDLRALKRFARYLIGTRYYGRRVELTMPGEEVEFIDAYGDADWLGDQRERRSTAGGAIVVGGA
eukprot:12967043-Alexandrium_andersonii.AAC.1